MKKHSFWQKQNGTNHLEYFFSDGGLWLVSYDSKSKNAKIFRKDTLISTCYVPDFTWDMHYNVRVPSFVIGLIKELQ